MNRRRIVVPALILAVPALALLLAPESEARRDRSDYLRRQPARIGLVARQKQPRELKRWRGTVRGYPQKTGKWERPDPPARDQIISRRPKKDRDEDMPKARKGMKDQSSMMEGKGRSRVFPMTRGRSCPSTRR